MKDSLANSRAILDRYFLEARAKLLDVAAILDRMDHAEASADVMVDDRRVKLDKALTILMDEDLDRAERIQLLFSRPYDPHWMDDFDGVRIHHQRSRGDD